MTDEVVVVVLMMIIMVMTMMVIMVKAMMISEEYKRYPVVNAFFRKFTMQRLKKELH